MICFSKYTRRSSSNSPLGKLGLFSKNSLYSCFNFSSPNLSINFKGPVLADSDDIVSMINFLSASMLLSPTNFLISPNLTTFPLPAADLALTGKFLSSFLSI